MQENPTNSKWEKYTRKYISEGQVVNPNMEDKLVREAAKNYMLLLAVEKLKQEHLSREYGKM